MKDIIKIITQILLFWGVTFWAVSGYEEKSLYVISGIWCLVLTLCCFWIRKKLKSIPLFLSGHVMLFFIGLAVIWMRNDSWGFAALMLIILSYSLLICCVPETEALEEPGYFQLIVLGIVFLSVLINGEKNQYILNYTFISFFAVLLLKVFYGNQKEMDAFVGNRASSTRMNEKKMKKLNTMLSFFYTGILCLILLAVNTFQTDDITRRIAAWIRNLIAILLGKIENGDGGGGDNEIGMLELIKGETSGFFMFLEALFKIVAVMTLLALVIGGIYCLIIAIYRQFYNRTDKMEDAQDYAESLTVSKKLPFKKRKSFFEKIERTPARQVRRMYKKCVYPSIYAEKKKMNHLSPKEQIAAVKLPKEKEEELLAIYEKARYSKAEVTKMDVERMKELVKS